MVIGAGMGGLSTALRLAHAGCQVTVFDAMPHVGGKMRQVPSAAGPIDAGPTVVTMRHVFDELFQTLGLRLEDHVTLTQDDILARHFWPDGSALDFHANLEETLSAIDRFSGSKARGEFLKFHQDTAALFSAFEGPMMLRADPRQTDLTLTVLKSPHLLRAMAPHQTLAQAIFKRFSDPRLAQVFARYSTYVGGNPYLSPALLSLIWQSEAAGVWRVKGGVHQLARAMQNIGQSMGVEFQLGQSIEAITKDADHVTGVTLSDGRHVAADIVVFNGDPRAIHIGLLGQDHAPRVTRAQVEPRSLSAYVWSFASRAWGKTLAHHNVFFGDDQRNEFDPIENGALPRDPTLYICAQDSGLNSNTDTALQRFEIIMNGAPTEAPTEREVAACRHLTFQTLADRGLIFPDPIPDSALMTPQDFATMFPASRGSLYGLSPHGMTAALKRPRARTSLKGLYLAGGGTHPGAGIPMACLSGRHAAEAILTDHALTLPSRPTAMRGGISTA